MLQVFTMFWCCSAVVGLGSVPQHTLPPRTHGPTMVPHREVLRWSARPTMAPSTAPAAPPTAQVPFEETADVRSDARCRVVLLCGPQAGAAGAPAARAVRGCYGEYVVRETAAAEDDALGEREIAGRPTYRWRGGVDGPARAGGPCPGGSTLLFFSPTLHAWAVGRPGRLLHRTGVPKALALVARGSSRARTPELFSGAWQRAVAVGSLRQAEHLARPGGGSMASSWSRVHTAPLSGVRASCKFFSSSAPSPAPTPRTTPRSSTLAAVTGSSPAAKALPQVPAPMPTPAPTPALTHAVTRAARPERGHSSAQASQAASVWTMPTWRPAGGTTAGAQWPTRKAVEHRAPGSRQEEATRVAHTSLAMRVALSLLVVSAFAAAAECVLFFLRRSKGDGALDHAEYEAISTSRNLDKISNLSHHHDDDDDEI